jgi:hypothetical protein
MNLALNFGSLLLLIVIGAFFIFRFVEFLRTKSRWRVS